MILRSASKSKRPTTAARAARYHVVEHRSAVIATNVEGTVTFLNPVAEN